MTVNPASAGARDEARDLLAYIDASPSPYHACATTAARLDAAGFTRLDERTAWSAPVDRAYIVRGGTLVAWSEPVGAGADPARPFRLLGAHTDSPNLRIKPHPDGGRAGFRQLGVEVYGGALLNSWLDRDLGLSGRVVTAGPGGEPVEHLVLVDRPLLRVPQLAIHLDRDVNERGVQLNKQQHLAPVWGVGGPSEGGFGSYLAELVGSSGGAGSVLAWDLMAHDVQPGALLGRDDELLAAPRIDNLASCWAATRALVAAAPADAAAVICLYDHEEVGSQSATGADSVLLGSVLERIVLARGGDREAFLRALAGSFCASVDGAHATHPNYVERHEPDHRIAVNGGAVVKHNSNERYATHADSEAVVVAAASAAGVPLQHFVTRSDLPCGSTIGPVTAARLGVPTVDLGMPMLSMHSARELCGAEDPALLVRLLTQLLT
jgi:aspartyl aminopeptidase